MYYEKVFYHSVINESLGEWGLESSYSMRIMKWRCVKYLGRMYGLTYEGTISRLLHKFSVRHVKYVNK